MRTETIEVVETELKRFAADLNLSDAQKTQLKSALENAHEKIEEVREKNPNASRADVVTKLRENRTAIRERVVKFLNPEQLTKWDAGGTKAKTFRGAQGPAVPGEPDRLTPFGPVPPASAPPAVARSYCASESGSIPLLASKEDPIAATTARFRSSAASSRIRNPASIPVQCAPSR